MQIKTFLRLMIRNKLPLLFKLNRAYTPFYKLSFAHASAANGMLDLFSDSPVDFETIMKRYAPDSNTEEILKAWLQLGIRLNEIKQNDKGYSLKGLSKKLASPHHDDYSALTQEIVGIHYNMIIKTPEILKDSQKWKFNDHDGRLIARSSRTLEPFIVEAIERTFPESGPVRLLEVGCGSAAYINLAAKRNPGLTAIGLELQNDVAKMATDNIATWGLKNRVSIEYADIRNFSCDTGFDIITFHNNIYYFNVAERTRLLTHAYNLLNPGGFIILTTGCQGGGPIISMLNVWCVTTEGYDRLPYPDEMSDQLHDAGCINISSINLIPGDKYYAFVGYRA